MTKPMEKSSPVITNVRRPDIYFHRTGRIDIASNVSSMLSLDKGDVINILKTSVGEFFLYVMIRQADKKNPLVNYKTSVYPTKRGSANFRTQSIELCRFISTLTGSDESWLFVGAPSDMGRFGLEEGTIGIPLIYGNNQYINYGNSDKDNKADRPVQ